MSSFFQDQGRYFRQLTVPASAAGRRVDVFLSRRFPEWSRSLIARHIREGLVDSDRRPLKASSALRAGELLRVFVPGIAPTGEPPPMPLVVYEDDHLLAVSKPAGLLVHPVGQRFEYGLIGLVRDARPGRVIAPAHRIDRETSGIVLLALSGEADRRMKEAFKRRLVQKSYLAIVRGQPDWQSTTVDAPIGKAGGELELRRAVRDEGDPATTRFFVEALLPRELALLRCEPVTGRTHQIRVHLEHAGFPILGDKIYGQPDDIFLEGRSHGATPRVREAVGFPRQCLHAFTLAFVHPYTGAPVHIEAPLLPDMAAVTQGEAPAWNEGTEHAGHDVAESDEPEGDEPDAVRA